jgi:sugar phosphate permease
LSEPAKSEPTTDPPLSWRARIFGISWLSYFSYYFTRKNYSVVKKSLERTTGLDADDLKLIDTLYLAGYSVGQFINGFLGEIIGPRRLVGIGMLVSAALAFIFAAGDALAIFAICYGLNGLAQSTGWPGNSRLMASWFSTERRGEIMGWWTTCYQVGGLAATALATFVLVRWGWQAAYIGNALWVVVAAIGFIFLVRDKPSTPGFAIPRSTTSRSGRPDRAGPSDWACCASR